MLEVTPQNLFDYLIRLNEAAKANDDELLLKLIILNTNRNIFFGDLSRITDHAGILRIISPELKGKHVYFAGDLSGTRAENQFDLQPGGLSLADTGYKTYVEGRLDAVHGLMGIMFSQIEKTNEFKLKEL